MKIETYEQELQSTEIGQLAADGEYAILVDQLDLKGQKSLLNDTGEQPFPYRRMTEIEKHVFEFHCPHKTSLAEYKSEVIPVRVLQVAAHALSLKFLNHIRVWHPKDAKLDPVLVGYTTNYGGDLFLLARWGVVWKEFPVLLEEAKIGWQKLRLAKLNKAKGEVEQRIKNVADDAELWFNGQTVDGCVYFSPEN